VYTSTSITSEIELVETTPVESTAVLVQRVYMCVTLVHETLGFIINNAYFIAIVSHSNRVHHKEAPNIAWHSVQHVLSLGNDVTASDCSLH
jgi:hypothetical protein